MLKLGRVTKVKVLFLVLEYVLILAYSSVFEFSAAILEKGLFGIPELFSFFTTAFRALRLVKFFHGDTNPSAVSSFSCFHDCVNGVLSHWGFLVPNA